ncbi:ribosomal RNA large subunit methyltransferase F-like protein [Chytriomyces cf. hyalinus JEL632]|nr:ribosomal RNA large subunit methyltransferase F-like protein [Chytriomyces cf. hyalinus JEL632]
MPPLSIYRPPENLLQVDFVQLSKQYPNLRSYVHRTRNSIWTIDFRNPKALRELSAAILWIHFQLRLEVPLDSLLPPIPNRLGYVYWTEHLSNHQALAISSETVHAIDIGTGASCIYPLLACKRKKNVNFLALDIDARQVEYAIENVARNGLEKRISVILNESTSAAILPLDILGSNSYTFCMCNPPFYKNANEIRLSRAQKSDLPSQTCTGRKTEMMTAGGELAFLRQLWKESLELSPHKVEWFTSLVGRKEDYLIFLRELEQPVERVELDVRCAEFQNGRTVRWGVAWRIKPE